ncbi:hypothetical protein WSM22_12260 [Cytophagales bacterium WSM2-2]|nr:hypothetical protein WSM22_12260 [Cytophagales bacterium WSM2-2]
MKFFTVLIAAVLLITGDVAAQSDSLQRQINAQVWKPFVKSFNSRDDDGFQAVHSKDVFRVLQDDNWIQGYDEYFKKVPDSIKARRGKWSRNIQLRFIQRIANNGKGFEVGYYKVTSVNAISGEKRINYGKFHVLLRKENGTWRILMDADANEKTDEMIFLSGKPIE